MTFSPSTKTPMKLEDMPSRVRAAVTEVSLATGVSVDDIMGPRRFSAINDARLEAYAAVRALAKPNGKPAFSLPQIGEIFGRDHTTIVGGLKRQAVLAGRRMDETGRAA